VAAHERHRHAAELACCRPCELPPVHPGHAHVGPQPVAGAAAAQRRQRHAAAPAVRIEQAVDELPESRPVGVVVPHQGAVAGFGGVLHPVAAESAPDRCRIDAQRLGPALTTDCVVASGRCAIAANVASVRPRAVSTAGSAARA
jgi:hypothetical protein